MPMLSFNPTRAQIAELHADQATCFATLLGNRMFIGGDFVAQAVRGDLRVTAATFYTTVGNLDRIVREDRDSSSDKREIRREVLVLVEARIVFHAEWSLGRFRIVEFHHGDWEEEIWTYQPIPSAREAKRGIRASTEATDDRRPS